MTMWRYNIVILLLLFIYPVEAIGFENPEMKVHYIDVGQGDSILIETPTDKVILIDGGPPNAGNKLVTYLKKQQVGEIDILFVTHQDYDHIGVLIIVIHYF